MKTTRYLLFVLCFFVAQMAAAQSATATLSGCVKDAVDGALVAGASIFLPELKDGTTTDADGRYSLASLPRKKLLVQVSYLGHQTIVQEVDLSKTSHLDFTLLESNAAIDEVVVTATGGATVMRNAPSPVSVVSAEQLRQYASTNIIDAVSRQAGLSQVSTGGGISKPVIRGLGYNRVVVVADGIRQEGQQWGDEHGVEVDAQTVGSVEILKGPGSLGYGSDAMAGVLVLHEAALPPRGQVNATATTEYQTNNGLFAYSLNAAGNNGGVVWSSRYSDKMAHAYQNARDGYVYGSGYRERAFKQLLGLNKQWGYSHLTLSYYHLTPGIIEGEHDEKDEDATPHHDFKTYGRTFPYQQIHHYKAVLDNTLFVGDGSLHLLLGYQHNRRQEFEEEEQPDECGLDFLLHTVNYTLSYQLQPINDWHTTLGTSGMYQRSLNKGEEYLIPEYNLFDYGIYITTARDFGRWHLRGGLRYDQRHLHSHPLTDDGSLRFSRFSRTFSGATGSIGFTYNIYDNLNIRANLSRGFRAPNMSEMAQTVFTRERNAMSEATRHSARRAAGRWT